MRPEQQYIDLFAEAEALICQHSAEALNAPRARAMEAFARLGLPGTRQEAYRHTDVGALFAPNFGMNLKRVNIAVDPHEVFRCDVPNLSTSLYFVVNDAFYPAPEIRRPRLPEGVLMGSLRQIAEQHPDLVRAHYARLARPEADGTVALNTAFAQDGILLYVPRGVVVERPIQIVNVLRADFDLMACRRVLIILEEGAQAKLLVCDHAMDNVHFLASQVVEAYVGQGASLDLYELEETHTSTARVSNLHVRQEADSRVLLNSMTLYNGTTRNNVHVHLAGPGAQLELCGMAIEDKDQHVDNHTTVDHDAPSCTSHELYKYVLDDRSTGAFNGLVRVRPGAQHTVSQQTSRNLCVTPSARMWTEPQLEIYADDVKCSHGATVGQLNDQALFYMRQRGVPEREARLLLMFAFVGEVIDTVRLEAMRDRLHHLVEKRFRGNLCKCQDCRIC